MSRLELVVRDKALVLETGEIARQSDGAVVVRYGETVILASVVAEKKTKTELDFFPLTIDYQEKAYAAGKIPGGFFKREGRPSEKEILTSRLIDRPLRPLFPKGFYSETQGIVSVLSYGKENISDVLGIIGMSSALMVSDIPFEGPVSAVRVGVLDGNFVINPDMEESERLEMDLIVAGTDDAILMVEGGGIEVSEDMLLSAIDFAHHEIRGISELQRMLKESAAKVKRELVEIAPDEELRRNVEEYIIERLKDAVKIQGKLKRQETLDIILNDALTHFSDPSKDRTRDITEIFYDVERRFVRNMILRDNIRADGRKPEEIRYIRCSVGILPRAHGSSLFMRGETQALVVATLGTSDDEQRIDALEGESYKAFMLHYNFLPFSVGEVKPLRSPGRREIGHGALAERALRPLIPSKEVFPYTIRVVSDILESNGSSSMATVCGASLALMDAGVRIKAPVAGIAMGLVVEGGETIILTDILGLEDHLGDMDFKVAGTEKGITAFQMDVKIAGIKRTVMETALQRAREGRLFMLKKMKEAIGAPRDVLSIYAPRIYTMQVKQEKIRDVIGTGGKVIRGIIEQTGVKININDAGVVNIAASDEASASKAIEIIKGIVEEPEVGKIYLGRVKRIVDFGAFVEILHNVEGLLHISQISQKRIEKVTDEINEGDEVLVKVIEIDRTGKIRLSRRETLKR